MIDLHGQAGLPYVNKGIYTGSFQGMRYRLRKKEEGEEKLLEAVIYPEPFCFEKTAIFRLQRRVSIRRSPG